MAARKKSTTPSSGSFLDRIATGVGGIGRLAASLWPSGPVLRTALVAVVWLAVGGGLVGLAWWGVPKLRDYADERSQIDPSRVRIVFERAPTWLPQETLDELGQRARAALAGAPIFEDDALERVHIALAESGWLERLEQVRRSDRDELVVSCDFRVPFAMVRVGDADHLVDEEGRRLPLAYEANAARPALPLIINVSMPKPAEAGTVWVGQDVHAALNLARMMRGKPWFAAGRVASIDAGRYRNEQVLEISTNEGNRIIWGSDPDDRSLGEMPAERKIACLDALWRAQRRLDDGSGRTLDLRFDVVTLAPTAVATNTASDEIEPRVPSKPKH